MSHRRRATAGSTSAATGDQEQGRIPAHHHPPEVLERLEPCERSVYARFVCQQGALDKKAVRAQLLNHPVFVPRSRGSRKSVVVRIIAQNWPRR